MHSRDHDIFAWQPLPPNECHFGVWFQHFLWLFDEEKQQSKEYYETNSILTVTTVLARILCMANYGGLNFAACAVIIKLWLCICPSIHIGSSPEANWYLTYLVCTSRIRCHWVLCGVFKICIVWLSLKILCSNILVAFADHLCLLRFLMSSWWTKEIVMASFQED